MSKCTLEYLLHQLLRYLKEYFKATPKLFITSLMLLSNFIIHLLKQSFHHLILKVDLLTHLLIYILNHLNQQLDLVYHFLILSFMKCFITIITIKDPFFKRKIILLYEELNLNHILMNNQGHK